MSSTGNQQYTTKSKRSRFMLILLMLVGISSCIVGYILGQQAVPQNGGEIVDTIVVTPGDAEEAQVSVSGIIRYADGTPAAHTKVELHSTPRTTVTDAKGYFFFHMANTGQHTLYVVNDKGEQIASCPVTVKANSGNKTVRIKGSLTTGYTVEIPANLLLLELEVTLDENTANGKPALSLSSVTAVKTDGTILTPEGSARPAENRTLTTAGGSIVFSDGTILLADGRVLLSDHSVVSKDGTVTTKDGKQTKSKDVLWTDNKAAVLPNGTVRTPGGFVVADGSTIIHPDGYVTLPEGTTVDAKKGEITLADGTVINPTDNTVTLPDGMEIDQNKNTITLPDGTVINQNDKTVTLPDGMVIDPNDKTITLPDGTVINPNDNTITLPDGMVIDQKDNIITLPDGTVVNPTDNTITLPDGTVVDQKDNTITLPDGTVVDQKDNVIIKPDGTVSKPTPSQPDNNFDIDNFIPDVPDIPVIPDDDKPGDDNTGDDENNGDNEDNNTGGDNTDDNTGDNSGSTSGGVGGSGGGSDDKDDETNTDNGKVSVSSEGKTWEQNTIVNLFAGIEKLYPGVEGTYTFNVSNTRSQTINFTMTVKDNNTNAIPFVLTLKDAGGNTVNPTNVPLAANSSMQYTLHWQWPYESGNDARDTAIGTSNNLSHTVTISIYAEDAA